MHTTFAVTTDGLPIGLLDQKISSRPPIAEEVNELRKRSYGNVLLYLIIMEDTAGYRAFHPTSYVYCFIHNFL